MALPVSITPITVSGKYLAPDGCAAVGTVSFTPSITAATAGTILPLAPQTITLDTAGAFSVVLAATDDPDWTAAGWTYTVTERIQGARVRTYNITVPAASPGGALDLASVVPVVVPAVVSSVLTVGNEVRNVVNFGARGNNIADDTAAIQAAIDAVPLGGGVVYFPTGTYKISSALVLESGVTLAGAGDVTIVIRQTSTTANCVQGVNVERVGLRNLQLVGPDSGSGHGLSLTMGVGSHIAYVSLEDVTVGSFGGDGIRVENPIASRLERVVANSNGGYGFNLFGQSGGAAGTSTHLSACYANANGTAGFRLFNLVYSALTACAADHNPIGYLVDGCQSVTLTGCGMEGNATVGVKVNGGYGVALVTPWVYDNRGVGIWVTGSAAVATIIGAVDNSPAGSATAFIKVDSGSRAALMSCNNTTANSLAAGTTNVLSDASGGMQINGYTALLSGGECDGDLVCFVSSKGYVLTDRSNGNRYRLKVDGGTLGVEVVA